MKCLDPDYMKIYWDVAPHEGAWIEIAIFVIAFLAVSVAPHEGAWIEMIEMP